LYVLHHVSLYHCNVFILIIVYRFLEFVNLPIKKVCVASHAGCLQRPVRRAGSDAQPVGLFLLVAHYPALQDQNAVLVLRAITLID
jgi:hypothetical protein